MISCPAAKQMRWVNPSMATVSPSRTSSATASRIEATLPSVTLGASGTLRRLRAGLVSDDDWSEGGNTLPRHLHTRRLEDPNGRPHLVLVDHERRGHPDGRVTRAKDQKALLEAGDLNCVG